MVYKNINQSTFTNPDFIAVYSECNGIYRPENYSPWYEISLIIHKRYLKNIRLHDRHPIAVISRCQQSHALAQIVGIQHRLQVKGRVKGHSLLKLCGEAIPVVDGRIALCIGYR